MSTTALSTLIDRLSQRIGDYNSVAVTTALTTDTNVVSTNWGNLPSYDNIYKPAWLYVVDQNNAGAYRRISSYTSSTTTVVVNGANFSSDGANLATVEIHKYDRNNKIRALNIAARKSYRNLFRLIRDITLTGNNILPNPSFEDWSSSSYPDYWTTLSNATTAESTTAGTVRGVRGSSSVKVTASSSNGYVELNSDTFPKLLDLMGRNVSIYVWANPQTADDATITIYTKQADGTAQTLASSTSNPAGEYTLLKLENQSLNDDLVEVRIRLGVATSGQYAYFDNARLHGINVYDYLLPLDFQNPLAQIDGVYMSVSNVQAESEDDLLTSNLFKPVYGWDTEDDSTTKYLTNLYVPEGRMIKIEGRAPLESDLSSATDTMTIEDPHLDLLIELAASELFNIEAGLPSAGDRDFLRSESLRYLANYEYMKKGLKMPKPQFQQRFRQGVV